MFETINSDSFFVLCTELLGLYCASKETLRVSSVPSNTSKQESHSPYFSRVWNCRTCFRNIGGLALKIAVCISDLKWDFGANFFAIFNVVSYRLSGEQLAICCYDESRAHAMSWRLPWGISRDRWRVLCLHRIHFALVATKSQFYALFWVCRSKEQNTRAP